MIRCSVCGHTACTETRTNADGLTVWIRVSCSTCRVVAEKGRKP